MEMERLLEEVREKATRDKETVEEAVKQLGELEEQLARLRETLRKLQGKDGKKARKARVSGNGLTTAEVRDAVSAVRRERPGVSATDLTAAVTAKLKASGKSLNGIALRLRTVLGEDGKGTEARASVPDQGSGQVVRGGNPREPNLTT